jgi:hypothetical protein
MKNDVSVFKVFQHSEEFFEMLSDTDYSRKVIVKQAGIILLFTLIYGIVMGSYNGIIQCLVTGLKMPCLICLSLIICFPVLFVIQYMIGSKMTFIQMSNILFSGFTVFSTILLSFAPIVVFFMITSDNYSFQKLLHVAIFVFSGFFAVKTIISGLSFSCEKKNIYPKLGMTVFTFWIFIYAFVSSQLAWNLRPFIGNRDIPFELFRNHRSNFYMEIIQSTIDLLMPDAPAADNTKTEQQGTR